jgi:hypothetical protein
MLKLLRLAPIHLTLSLPTYFHFRFGWALAATISLAVVWPVARGKRIPSPEG